MTSSRPYLLRAVYEWLLDNEMTPHLMVDATVENVMVPEQFIENGKIVLNIAPQAIANLLMSNSAVEFNASFGGKNANIYLPVIAVKAIFAYENGRGMVFSDEEESGGEGGPSEPPSTKKKTPHLKVVK